MVWAALAAACLLLRLPTVDDPCRRVILAAARLRVSFIAATARLCIAGSIAGLLFFVAA